MNDVPEVTRPSIKRVEEFFLPYQRDWLRDESRLKIMEKSRQVGITFADAYDSVRKVSCRGARLDVWISSRDERQAQLYLQDCARWARVLRVAAAPACRVFEGGRHISAYALQFRTGRCIYSLSSNPNALAGKRGHVKLDEFALHQDQRLLYRVAKPVTMWGGQLCLISTHRGSQSVFNELIRQVREGGNPMGWSLHSVPLQRAVDEGLSSRISGKNRVEETPEAFVARLHAECIDEEQWLQEYCCVPADEAASFLNYELLQACCEPGYLQPVQEVGHSPNPLYLGLDVARKTDLCVLDIGERIGDVTWDRVRLELRDKTFAEIQSELYQWLSLKQLKRACIDATGLGMQLAEQAAQKFGWKVEPITFTAALKEELAFDLRADFEARRLRIPSDEALFADLRGIRKEVTSAGNIRFVGESMDSHCDRFWAKALRQHAARAGGFPGGKSA